MQKALYGILYCRSFKCKCKDHLKAMKEELQRDFQEMIDPGVLVEGVDVNVTDHITL